MRRILTIVLAVLCVAALAACTHETQTDIEEPDTAPVAASSEEYNNIPDIEKGEYSIDIPELGFENEIKVPEWNPKEPVSVDGDFVAKEDENGRWYIVCYTGEAENIIVPKTVDGRKAEYISEGAFYGETVRNIRFEAEFKEIPQELFVGHDELETVFLPEGLETICEYAFSGCSSLRYVGLPSTLRVIKHYAFENCTSLEQITLPEGLEEIGYYTFLQAGLKTVRIPASVKELKGRVFEGCENLKEIFVEGNDTVIERTAFGDSAKIVIHGTAGSAAERFVTSERDSRFKFKSN